MLSRRILVLLDVFVGVLCAVQLSDFVALLVVGTLDVPRAVPVLGAAGVIVMAAAWTGWRLSRRRWLLLLFAAATFATSASSGNSMTLILLLLGLSLVTLGYDVRVGALLLTLELIAMTLAMRFVFHRSWSAVVGETIAASLLLGLGLILGMVMRELQREQIRNAELVDQVRRSAETEKELMLADERSRSARELHDGLGHQLTLIQMSLEYAERMRERDPERAVAEIAQARDTAREALAYMRRWVRALNPPREANLSGTRAFEAIADSFRGTGLDIIVDHTGTERELDRDTSLFAYRMVQEGLTNVVRHSTADRVSLTIDWRPEGIDLKLRDNGGPAPGDLRDGGFGLRSLAERAAELGGRFSAEATEHGMLLSGSVPSRVAV